MRHHVRPALNVTRAIVMRALHVIALLRYLPANVIVQIINFIKTIIQQVRLIRV